MVILPFPYAKEAKSHYRRSNVGGRRKRPTDFPNCINHFTSYPLASFYTIRIRRKESNSWGRFEGLLRSRPDSGVESDQRKGFSFNNPSLSSRWQGQKGANSVCLDAFLLRKSVVSSPSCTRIRKTYPGEVSSSSGHNPNLVKGRLGVDSALVLRRFSTVRAYGDSIAGPFIPTSPKVLPQTGRR